MAFSTASSRFALLTDDVSDPFVKKGKAKVQNTSTTGKSGVSGSAQSQKKAKDTKSAHGANANATKKPKNGTSVGSGNASTKSKNHIPVSNSDRKTKPNGAVLDWDAWERRDTEFVAAEYQSQLEEALLQSKLEFQKQQLNQHSAPPGLTASKPPKTKKKKNIAVPIFQFQGSVPADTNANQTASKPATLDDDESLIERLRIETQRELVREKQCADEKAILLSRNAHFLNGNANTGVAVADNPEAQMSDGMADQDLRIRILQLEKDKQVLEEELDVFKARFKRLLGLLNDSELKEKVHLQRDLEKMAESNQELSKLNQDLNDELKNAYSQLEQERSRSHAALMEVKKMSEQSRKLHGRTHSQMELVP